METHYIDNEAELTLVCEQLSKADILAVDTEFVRTRTLFPKLGLLQFSDSEHVYLIDPIAIEDLTPVWALLTDPNILKLIHSCSEDLEVFLTAGCGAPQNMLDTQVCMTFLGHGLSLGYAGMIQHYTELELDKSESRTDWTKRPLSPKQLTYAAADVEYLHKVSATILSEMRAANWLEEALEESSRLITRKYQAVAKETLYLDVKQASRLNREQLNNLRELARWRYERAVHRDVPLGFVAKDPTLIVVAQRSPKSVGAMASYNGIEMLDVRHQGKAMLNVLKQAHQVPPELYPHTISRLDDYPGYKQIFKQTKEFLQLLAKSKNIPLELCGSKKQINQFLSFYWHLNDIKAQDVDLLVGWRKNYISDDLIAFANAGFKR